MLISAKSGSVFIAKNGIMLQLRVEFMGFTALASLSSCREYELFFAESYLRAYPCFYMAILCAMSDPTIFLSFKVLEGKGTYIPPAYCDEPTDDLNDISDSND